VLLHLRPTSVQLQFALQHQMPPFVPLWHLLLLLWQRSLLPLLQRSLLPLLLLQLHLLAQLFVQQQF
jgi:hypothetical protein